MKLMTKALAGTALVLALGATAASAQGYLIGTTAVDDRINDIDFEARRNLDRAEDARRFGSDQFAPGWTGSLSASYTGATGNTETQDLAIGARLNYNMDRFSQTIGIALEYGEADDVKNKEESFFIYDANYTVNGNFYVFGLGRLAVDKFAALETDAFLGFGPGYRIINTEDMAWRVQAGPGVRYTEDPLAGEETEVAGILSSRFFYRFSDGVFMTNDTDILTSDVGTLNTNDFGINFAMTDALSARLGYRVDYNSQPAPGSESTDNRISASLVYSLR